jgi:hypothetical protein
MTKGWRSRRRKGNRSCEHLGDRDGNIKKRAINVWLGRVMGEFQEMDGEGMNL